MRRLLYVGLAFSAALSVVAVVVATASVSGGSDLDRVRSALRLQTNCPNIAVRRPSRAGVTQRWRASTAQSADVDCESAGPGMIYVKFNDRASASRALVANPPPQQYCLIGEAIVMARVVGSASTLLSDICQSLGGTLGTRSSPD